jgi:outer membrane immunogenic protein
MLKRFLFGSVGAFALAGAASAADLPVAPPPAFTWTGFYLGGQVGYGWGEDSGRANIVGPLGAVPYPGINVSTSTQTQGVIGGAHIGYNWQFNQIVFGLEGQVDGTSLSKTIQPVYNLSYASTTKSQIQGSFLGRLGVAFDRTLVYAVGGGGYGQILNNYTILAQSASFATARAFWTVGAGVEYAVNDNWLIRAEYRYNKYGYINDGPIVFPSVYQSHTWSQNQVQVGFSYKFGPPAPAAVAKF